MFDISSSSSCFFWKVALIAVVVVSGMIARAQELRELADEETTAAANAAIGDDDGEKDGGDDVGPNTRIAKTVEYWVPVAMGGVLFLVLLGCCMFNIYRAGRRAREGRRGGHEKSEEKLEHNHPSPWRNPSIRNHQQPEQLRSHSSKQPGDHYLPSLYLPAQNGSTGSTSSAYRSHRDDANWSSPIEAPKVRPSLSGGVSSSIHDLHYSYRSSSSTVFPLNRSPVRHQQKKRPELEEVGVYNSNRRPGAGELGRENSNPRLERSLSQNSSTSARNFGRGRSSNMLNTIGLSASLSDGLFKGDELQGKKAPGEKGNVHRNPMVKCVSSGAARKHLDNRGEATTRSSGLVAPPSAQIAAPRGSFPSSKKSCIRGKRKKKD